MKRKDSLRATLQSPRSAHRQPTGNITPTIWGLRFTPQSRSCPHKGSSWSGRIYSRGWQQSKCGGQAWNQNKYCRSEKARSPLRLPCAPPAPRLRTLISALQPCHALTTADTPISFRLKCVCVQWSIECYCPVNNLSRSSWFLPASFLRTDFTS